MRTQRSSQSGGRGNPFHSTGRGTPSQSFGRGNPPQPVWRTNPSQQGRGRGSKRTHATANRSSQTGPSNPAPTQQNGFNYNQYPWDNVLAGIRLNREDPSSHRAWWQHVYPAHARSRLPIASWARSAKVKTTSTMSTPRVGTGPSRCAPNTPGSRNGSKRVRSVGILVVAAVEFLPPLYTRSGLGTTQLPFTIVRTSTRKLHTLYLLIIG